MCKERDSEERFVDQHLEIGEWVEDQLDSPIALDTILFITQVTYVVHLHHVGTKKSHTLSAPGLSIALGNPSLPKPGSARNTINVKNKMQYCKVVNWSQPNYLMSKPGKQTPQYSVPKER